MISRTNLLFEYLTQPVATLRYLIDHPPLGLILIMFLFAQFADHLAGGLGNPLMSSVAMTYLFGGFIMKLAMVACIVIVIVSMIHFSSELFGTTGSVSSLFLLFLLSFTPFIFRAPAAFIPGNWSYVLTIVILGWIVVLQVKSVQVVYRLSAGKALLAYLAPVFFLMVIVPLLAIATFLFTVMLHITLITK